MERERGPRNDEQHELLPATRYPVTVTRSLLPAVPAWPQCRVVDSARQITMESRKLAQQGQKFISLREKRERRGSASRRGSGRGDGPVHVCVFVCVCMGVGRVLVCVNCNLLHHVKMKRFRERCRHTAGVCCCCAAADVAVVVVAAVGALCKQQLKKLPACCCCRTLATKRKLSKTVRAADECSAPFKYK